MLKKNIDNCLIYNTKQRNKRRVGSKNASARIHNNAYCKSKLDIVHTIYLAPVQKFSILPRASSERG